MNIIEIYGVEDKLCVDVNRVANQQRLFVN